MGSEDLAAAMRRFGDVLRSRPQFGIHADTPATARWEAGTRVVTGHDNGSRVATDMPAELGGSGDQVSPGWLFRAAMASCLATVVAMNAAAEGIELTLLVVRATSRSDTRGILGIADGEGAPVFAGPGEVRIHVRIAANGASRERLRDLVERSRLCSPVPVAVQNALPVDIHVEYE